MSKSPNFFLGVAIFGFPPAYIGMLIAMLYDSWSAPAFGGFLAMFFLVLLPAAPFLFVAAMNKGSKMDRNK